MNVFDDKITSSEKKLLQAIEAILISSYETKHSIIVKGRTPKDDKAWVVFDRYMENMRNAFKERMFELYDLDSSLK